jgi:hypothetical protein
VFAGAYRRPSMLQALITNIMGSEARAQFERARRACRGARALRTLTARQLSGTRPRDLGSTAALAWGLGRLRTIPLESIVGTVDPTADFDAEFRPTTNRVASRWQSIAHASLEGRRLPPIEVVEAPDGYYVVDGRHRVSVARALNKHVIDARTSPVVNMPRTRQPEPATSAIRCLVPTTPTGRTRASIASTPADTARGPGSTTSGGGCTCTAPARSRRRAIHPLARQGDPRPLGDT